ncbi:MAG: HEAT repeat domain-containing protein, partial [Candidatus Saccharimonas sp.]|nr:HEAT repeat domain-containing protein [Planctomycetaceae bacterium]
RRSPLRDGGKGKEEKGDLQSGSRRGQETRAEQTSLLVLAPPNLLAFHDDNGDGVSDRSDVLVKGIGFDLKFRGADHTTNGIQVGIDGWIYVAVGDYGFIRATGSDGRELAYRGGGIVRCRPDGSELEVVSHGQRNIYDVAISPELDLFTRDNTNDGGGWNVRLSHVPHGGQMGYPSLFVNFPDEIIQPLADYGGGSPCGSLFIDEPTLPEGLGQSLYTCDWGRSVVYRHPLTKNGAGFTAEQEPFVELPRPTDMDIDAKGNIYISSWRDGGFNFSKPEVGYVVMVKSPTVIGGNDGSKGTNRTYESTIEYFLQRLASPSHTVRLYAQRRILARGASPKVASGLEQLAASQASVAVRVATIFTLKQLLGEKSHEALAELAKDASIREHALRAIADRTTQLGNTSPQPFVEALSDTNPRVRLQAARALGRFGKLPREALVKLLPLTVDRDPLVAHVAIDSLVQLNAGEVCLAALISAPEEHRLGAAMVLRHLHDPTVVAGLLDWLGLPIRPKPGGPTGQAISDHMTRQLVLATLCRLHSREGEYTGDWWGTRPDTSGPY